MLNVNVISSRGAGGVPARALLGLRPRVRARPGRRPGWPRRPHPASHRPAAHHQNRKQRQNVRPKFK